MYFRTCYEDLLIFYSDNFFLGIQRLHVGDPLLHGKQYVDDSGISIFTDTIFYNHSIFRLCSKGEFFHSTYYLCVSCVECTQDVCILDFMDVLRQYNQKIKFLCIQSCDKSRRHKPIQLLL